MSRLATSFVLGYHGCDKEVGERAILGEAGLLWSDKAYDWLGPGAYFWESDPKRALEWANWKVSIGEYKQAFVVGAVIDLRNCLDLVSRDDLEILRGAYESFASVREAAGLEMPVNKNVRGQDDQDRKLRFLDCAVIKHLHSIMEDDPELGAYETVRGMFTEGGELYPNAGFTRLAHVQIAVRARECIRGFFIPAPYPE